ncbi:PQQ-binding-like beta-propeller repeat protein [Plantactinospora mayteni]|uniref:Serine/threonine protein kinase n=1 Tax=Plantactinospora mayteni TaxID=566021 RepID=A0ABQ4EK19_9ACTN|nr:PQQ-binding-like beta-propeller repeat protein [Plantactinospora mayteni]GIG95066.1 serine/threonine protein kinase [Plantactinospora mayteni]
MNVTGIDHRSTGPPAPPGPPRRRPAGTLAGAMVGAVLALLLGYLPGARLGLPGRPTAPTGPQLRWTFSAAVETHAGPVVAGDTVYLGSADGILYALDAATGTVRWTHPIPEPDTTLTVADGVLYLAGSELLSALDVDTHQLRWSYRVGGSLRSTLSAADGLVYLADQHGSLGPTLYALDQATGQLRWTRDLGHLDGTGPTVAHGLVYVGGDHTLYALDARTGAVRWSYPELPGPVGAAPVVSERAVHITAADSYLGAFDLWDGRKLWSHEADLVASPVVRDDTLYVPVGTGCCFDRWRTNAYRASTGELLWSAAFHASELVSAGAILYSRAADDGTVYAFDPATGEPGWRFPAGDRNSGAPAATGETVYVADGEHTLFAVRAPPPPPWR